MKLKKNFLILFAALLLGAAAAGCAGSTVYVSGGVGYGGYYGPHPWGGYGGYPGGTVVIGVPPRLY